MTVATKTCERRIARPVSKQRLRLWLRLLRSSRAIEAKLRERLRAKYAVTLPQFDVMAALARHESGMTMTELSRRLMVSNGNVTGIIDRLAAEKLVLRQHRLATVDPISSGLRRKERHNFQQWRRYMKRGSMNCWSESMPWKQNR